MVNTIFHFDIVLVYCFFSFAILTFRCWEFFGQNVYFVGKLFDRELLFRINNNANNDIDSNKQKLIESINKSKQMNWQMTKIHDLNADADDDENKQHYLQYAMP